MIEVSSVVSIPLTMLSQGDLKQLKKDLTFRYQAYGETEVRFITAYEQDETYISVPRNMGLNFAAKFEVGSLALLDNTSDGAKITNKLKPITLWEHQTPIVEDAVTKFIDDEEYDIVLEAGTGYGKTVMGTEIARRLNVKTLIIVDQDNLVKQWRDDTANKIFGLPADKIGHVQGKVADYEGKTIVVATVQTLVLDKLPESFYSEFGLVIWDEGHTTSAAEGFSKTLWWFNARYRLMVSATPDRYDAFGKIMEAHLGEPKVVTDHKHGRSDVKYINYSGVYSRFAMTAKKKGRLITEIAEDGKRNLLIAKAVKYMYDEGRDVLILSDRVEQLHNLVSMLQYMGVPKNKVGLNTGDIYSWRYAKDPTPPRRPRGIEKGCEYTPISLQYKKKKATVQQKEQVKLECSIISATFGIFKKGVDVPRLSGGIDATPQAAAKQAHGRILRETPDYPDKMTPLWITIRDNKVLKCEKWFAARVNDYTQSNAEVQRWKQQDNVSEQELLREVARNLKRLTGKSVSTRPDGTYTLQT